ncbi:glycoside hydrolase family 18, catalytic domain-containing protein [Artemisia annua]|uniref:Glycoside hydrolase family 18, catalytic domain-containing protein n=1 Tax=Artemisia annua TaxID=35608 RepID=A0A2U1PND6_ARTAN|nr:glycoside hydrolase family 18, catalytic domain-containing protein [Artemisia annua]
MVVDFKKAKLEEVIGKLKTYEERLKFRKGSEEDNSEKLLFTRQGNNRNYERNYGNDKRGGGNQTRGRGQGRFTRDSKNGDSYDRNKRNNGDQNYHRRDFREIECYNCHEFGHFAANCPKPNRREEKANLVFEDDEPALLMLCFDPVHYPKSVAKNYMMKMRVKKTLEHYRLIPSATISTNTNTHTNSYLIHKEDAGKIKARKRTYKTVLSLNPPRSDSVV